MPKSWIGLIIVAAIVLWGWTGYQFYVAITGQGEEEFSHDVEKISDKFPEDILNKTFEEKDRVFLQLNDIEVQQN